ncbi:MAG: hypothetical protein HYZ29_36345 [Myxococcales bacterium]|nr:hypothetical protein [Myxococcales bacterium]
MTDDSNEIDDDPRDTANMRPQRFIEEELRDDPDLPHHCAPFDLDPDDEERLVELEKQLGRMVRAGTFSRSTALSLIRTARRAARAFVPSRIKLTHVLGALVQAADCGILRQGREWARPDAGLMALHVATALPLLRDLGLTRVYERELRRLLHQGAGYRPETIVALRDRVTFGLRDRRRALVLRDATLRAGVSPSMLIRGGPHRGRFVPSEVSAEALHEQRRSAQR